MLHYFRAERLAEKLKSEQYKSLLGNRSFALLKGFVRKFSELSCGWVFSFGSLGVIIAGSELHLVIST